MRVFILFCVIISLFGSEDKAFPQLRETSHVYTSGEHSMPYNAVTGFFPVYGAKNKLLANLFFIAYFVQDAPERPITFIFPGGPGGSCQAEVLCTIGPHRLLTPQEGKSLLPPYKIIDNPQSLLPWTDLVFIDPVTTGYSQFAEEVEEEEKNRFFSTDGDIQSLGDFVQTFVSYFEKWNCPKYLSGISYGTLRCCGLAEYLGRYDLSLHGIIILGSAIDFSTLVGQRNLPLPDSLLIPTFAATAWYHGRLWPESTLDEVVDYARRFVYEDYTPFMLQPTRLSPAEQNVFYSNLAQLIGLKEETVRRYGGRFDETLFTTEFMAQERKVIGGLDTRYTSDLSSIQRLPFEDPSYRDMQGISCAFNAYLQKELETGCPLDPSYVSSANHASWNFATYDSFLLPDVLQRLRRTLIRNPSMSVFSGSGYYDCRTPFAATEFCLDHMDLPMSYRNNFQFEYYEAGHGFVFDLPSLQKLHKDLVKFYTRTH